MANLQKKRKEKEVVEERELVPKKRPKQQKTAKGKGRVSSVKSNEDPNVAEVRPQNSMWDPQLELEVVAIPQSSSIREF